MPDIFWNPNRVSSYNCLFNFIIGPRGTGKTYGSLKREIKRFINSPASKPCQFMYVRRIKTELKKLTTANHGRLFDAVAKEFPNHVLEAKGDVLYCDEKVMGYAVALSTASTLKSDAFPNVTEIVFDEFIIDNTRTYHYLPDEVRKFQDLYETVARPGSDPNREDVKVWFLSNAVTVNNPYFAEFHLAPPANGDIQRFGSTKDILVQNVQAPSVIERKKATRFGQMIKGSAYSDYAYDNQWLLDDNYFIEHKTARSKYFLSIRYKNQWLGIWFDRLQQLYYVSFDYDDTFPIKYSATTDDHMPNTLLFKRARQNPYIRYLMDAYDCGAVRYESIKLKGMFRDIMRMCY